MSEDRLIQPPPNRVLHGHQGTAEDFVEAWRQKAAGLAARGTEVVRRESAMILPIIADTKNLQIAWERCARGVGQAPGRDGKRYKDFTVAARFELLRTAGEAIRNDAYRPVRPLVKQVPKAGGGRRSISLFNVGDRVIMRGIQQILQPLVEPRLSADTFGSRRQGGSVHAVARLAALVEQGDRPVWITEDICNAFDSVPRQQLLGVVRHWFADERLVSLIKRGIEVTRGKRGIPQGSPLSPLLLDLFLDHFLDRPWERRDAGVTLLRYVDDMLLMCRTPEEARASYQELHRLLRAAGLQLKGTENSAIFDSTAGGSVDWLGYRLSVVGGALQIRLRTDYHERLRQRLCDCHRHPHAVARAAATIRGWFHFAGPAFRAEDRQLVLQTIRHTAADCGFAELPDVATLELWWRLGSRRWNRIVRRARQAAGLVSPPDALGNQADQVYLARRLAGAEFVLYTDGSCLPSSRCGGWAFLLRSDVGRRLMRGGLRRTTNNRAELQAVIRGLLLTPERSRVQVVTDSRYVADGIARWLPLWIQHGQGTRSGRPIKNARLWRRLHDLMQAREVKATWIAGHGDLDENVLVDQWAGMAARRMERRLGNAAEQ